MKGYLLRAAALLSAAAMLTGCSLTKTSSSEETFISEESIPEEPVFQELTEEDFTEISVNISVNEAADLPIEMHRLEMNNVDFGERLSPCKKEEVRDEFIQAELDQNYSRWNEEAVEYQRNYLTDICSIPNKGQVWLGALHEDTAYYAVFFDDLCDVGSLFGHEWAIFSCDTETGRAQELWTYSSTDERAHIENMRYCQGRLYFIIGYYDHFEELSGGSGRIVTRESFMELDLASGQAREIAAQMSTDDGQFGYFLDTQDDRLIMAVYNAAGSQSDLIMTLREYDPQTGSFTDIVSGSGLSTPYCGSKGIVYAEETDDRKTRVVTEWYTLETGSSANIAAADEHRCYLHGTDTYGSTILYCYDVDKHEKYTLNSSGIGSLRAISGSCIVTSTGLFSYCLIPDLGAAFPIAGEQASSMTHHDGSRAYFGNYGQYQGRNYYSDETGHISLDVKPETTQDLTITWFES
ncbi:MAG: hypothetical protein IJ071_12010 [Ruminococcus sp.]|nr:hypothetical protein [Ruminococcus sp.]